MPPNNGTAVARRPTGKQALAQLEQVVIRGDLSVLSEAERIGYYARVCESLGINPLTRPFEYITLNNRLVLYARKDAADQLRAINGISVDRLDRERDEPLGLAIVTAYGHDRGGRTDSAMGAVSIKGLSGEAMANALMKAETKAKRRMTLSLAGLGWLDESEIETAQIVGDPVTTEERTEKVASRAAALESKAPTPTVVGEASEPAAKVVDVDAIPFEQAPPADEATALWMRSIHAAGAERGLDHDHIHEMAAKAFGAASLNDLDENQRVRLLAAVQGAPACSHPSRQHQVTERGVVCGACGVLLASREGAINSRSGSGPDGGVKDSGEAAPVATEERVKAGVALDAAPSPTQPGQETEAGGGTAAAPSGKPAPVTEPAGGVVPPGPVSPATPPAASRGRGRAARKESTKRAPSAPAAAPSDDQLRTRYAWTKEHGWDDEALDEAAIAATGHSVLEMSNSEWKVYAATITAGPPPEPPKRGTQAYAELPDGLARAHARAYWTKRDADQARDAATASLAAAAVGKHG
jgi:hypothetical protein